MAVLALAGTGLFVLGVFPRTHDRVLRVKGATIEEWAKRNDVVWFTLTSRAESTRAIKAFGTNAVPQLVRMASRHDSGLKTLCMRILNNQNFIPIHIDSATDDRRHALSALCTLGPDARHALPTILKALNDTDYWVRSSACIALCQTADLLLKTEDWENISIVTSDTGSRPSTNEAPIADLARLLPQGTARTPSLAVVTVPAERLYLFGQAGPTIEDTLGEIEKLLHGVGVRKIIFLSSQHGFLAELHPSNQR